MIASDIPAGYTSPGKMARSLATYLDDPKEIRRRVLEVFGTCPCTADIRRFRRIHLRIEYSEPFRAHEVYDLQEAQKRAKAVSDAFLAAILNERANSRYAMASREDLNSTFLTQPALVDKAWERACR